MNWLTIEHGVCSVAIGAFLSFFVATFVVPFGSLAWIFVFCVLVPIGAAVVYRVRLMYGISPQTEKPGQLTLLFFVGFTAILVGYIVTSELTADGSVLEFVGQVLSFVVGWWLANWLVYRGGFERLRGRVTN